MGPVSGFRFLGRKIFRVWEALALGMEVAMV